MLSTISPDLLCELSGQRWLMPVLARFHGVSGLRFAELRRGLDLPRDSLTRTLERLQALGWIERNPGHGHPLRPEYVLGAKGRQAAAIAALLAERLEGSGLAPHGLTRWSLPALQAIVLGDDRFNQLVRTLAPASPRALSETLRSLAANDLVERRVEAGFPPTSRYLLTAKGRVLAA